MPATPFIDDATLRAELLAVVKPPDPIGLPDQPWSTIVTAANLDATADILDSLTSLGFTPAQIRSSDYIASWAKDQGLYRALLRGTGLHGVDEKSRDAFDRREYLRTRATLVIGDVAVGPTIGAQDVGGIGYGRSELRDRLSAEYDRRFGETSRGGDCNW